MKEQNNNERKEKPKKMFTKEKRFYAYFSKDDIGAEIIVINKINKEDIKLAKKYNINPAKAAYINSIVKDKTYIDKSKALQFCRALRVYY